jgi:hypothetical protein
MSDEMTRRALALGLGASILAPAMAHAQSEGTYTEEQIVREAEEFFGESAEGLANAVAHVFQDLGQPNGFIKGQEGSGAAFFGLRYGRGELRLASLYDATPVFWQGPSVGPDAGGNASKVFTLVYNMREPGDIFRRFPGVDGSAYLVGGFGVNYARKDGITLAPIRSGVGLRLGANIGYLRYSRNRRYFPF